MEDARIVHTPLILDTLAQLGTDTRKTLKKRARAKYFTNALSVKLADVKDSSLTKSYWNSYYCNNVLVVDNGTVTGRYCNNRWCSVCNRIRVAKLINGYAKPLQELENRQFVTLTVPNCAASELKATIVEMQMRFKSIMEIMKRRHQRGNIDFQIRGIRKIECTYNPLRDDYHPHFHLIVEGFRCAVVIQSEWLKRYSGTVRQAQNIRRADKNSEIELFKYFAKIVTKTGRGDFKAYTKPLDVIFQSMRGQRVFQPIGISKDIDENIEELNSQLISGLEDCNGYLEWNNEDWFCLDTGEAFTGYEPSESMKSLIKNII